MLGYQFATRTRNPDVPFQFDLELVCTRNPIAAKPLVTFDKSELSHRSSNRVDGCSLSLMFGPFGLVKASNTPAARKAIAPIVNSFSPPSQYRSLCPAAMKHVTKLVFLGYLASLIGSITPKPNARKAALTKGHVTMSH
jgi:hypothetical protein